METSKGRPNTPPSLKLLEQRVYELVGGPLKPPSPPPTPCDLYGDQALSSSLDLRMSNKEDFKTLKQ